MEFRWQGLDSFFRPCVSVDPAIDKAELRFIREFGSAVCVRFVSGDDLIVVRVFQPAGLERYATTRS